MDKEENPIKLLRLLRGAPLSVFLALNFANQPMTEKWLENATGYTDKTIKKALDLLTEYEMVLRARKGWRIRKEKQLKLEIVQEIEMGNKNRKYKELFDFGIGEPKLSEIVKDESISCEFIHAHVLKAIEDDCSPGLLIHRIMNKDKPPRLNKNGHLEGCKCPKCEYQKYENNY